MSDGSDPHPSNTDGGGAGGASGDGGAAPKDRQQVEREARELRERLERRARESQEAHKAQPVQERVKRTSPAKQAERDAAKRKRSKVVALGVTAAVVGAGVVAVVTLGGEEEPVTQAAYCVDQASGTRVEDAQCETGSGGGGSGGGMHGWYFIPIGWGAPGIGGRATGGSFTTPSGSSYVQGGVPRAGGTVTTSNLSGGKTTTVRGGFGSKGFGGGG